MALWGKTDATPSRPNWLKAADYPAGTQFLFVDREEAALEANKKKGIKGPGWYVLKTHKDSSGKKRWKAELIVAMSVPVATSGDAADDLFVPDVNVEVTITVQPTDQTAVAGAATFATTATIAPSGTLAYQWQYQPAAETGAWVDVPGATSASLALTARTVANNGDKYRVEVSGSGAAPVTSDVAVLTVSA